MASRGVPQHHIVWGKVDLSGSQSDVGSSADNSSPEARRGASKMMLAGDILQSITFEPESESSAQVSASAERSGARKQSSGGDSAPWVSAALSSQRADKAAQATGSRSSGAPGSAASGGDDLAGEDSDDEPDGAGGGHSFVWDVVRCFESRDFLVVVAAVLQRGGPDAEPFMEHWSEGAKRHQNGETCRPCHYNYSATGCTSGANCGYCHLPHMKSKPRASKPKRNQHYRFRLSLEQLMETHPDVVMGIFGMIAEGNHRVRAILSRAGAPAASSSCRTKNVMSL
mmetsp:Transcript_44752/g.130306  ORF Transcript_44752/g.130306 Transcript_44752/m.130306 type:complete len:284 (-) Transcript_44752:237-1088(-)